MKKYGIVVDSGCDMNNYFTDEHDSIVFRRVALTLYIGEQQFKDDVSLNIETFMESMHAYQGKSGSAAPSPSDWLEAFEEAENVVAITITGTLSGSFASANVAAGMFLEQHPDRHIFLLDSKSAGPEMALLARKAAELMKNDLDFAQIEQQLRSYQKQTGLLYILGSLDNLIKNGRVSKLTAGLAGILGIQIVGIASKEGTLELLHKCRGKRCAYETAIKDILARNYQGGKIVIAHCFAPDGARYIADAIRTLYKNAEIELIATGGLCSFYAERGGIMIGFE